MGWNRERAGTMVRRVSVRRRIVANHLDNDVSKPKTARHDQQPVLIHNVGEHRAMEMGRTCCRGGPGQGRAGRPEHWWWVTYPLTIHDKQSNAANLVPLLLTKVTESS